MKKKTVFFWDDVRFREFLHYVVVFSVLLGSWVPVMDYFTVTIGEESKVLFWTSLTVFIIFIIADQLAHRLLQID